VFTAAVLLAAVRCIRFIVSRFRRRLPVTVEALGSKRAYVNGDRQNTGFALKKLSAVGETNLM